MSKPKQPERRELWRQRIAQQEISGQRVRAFCRQQNLSEASFYMWRKQLGSPTAGTPVRFALVEASRPGHGQRRPPSPQAPLELVLASGERLHIPADEAMLRLVLSVLRKEEQPVT